MRLVGIRALLFDVFGTCVDWRAGVIRDSEALGRRLGLNVDWAAFADAWRADYQPSMEEVRSGRRSWTVLDALHRETLDRLVTRFAIAGRLDAGERDEFNRVWHRLDPWPDVVTGLSRLKARYIIAPLSNGNFALLTNMAKRAGLPWDVNLSCEVMRAYKPLPESYLGAVRLLGLAPAQAMLVAAHNSDLKAASALGLRTAFVPRPGEHGAGQTADLAPEGPWDIVAADFGDLATRLGA